MPSTLGIVSSHIRPTYYNTVQFTAPGTTTYTVPAGVKQISAKIQAGGGAGGAGFRNSVYGSNGSLYAGCGGGAGGYRVIPFFDVTPGDVLTITVGAGGIASARPTAANGGSGGNSSLTTPTTSFSVTGGTAGTGLEAFSPPNNTATYIVDNTYTLEQMGSLYPGSNGTPSNNSVNPTNGGTQALTIPIDSGTSAVQNGGKGGYTSYGAGSYGSGGDGGRIGNWASNVDPSPRVWETRNYSGLGSAGLITTNNLGKNWSVKANPEVINATYTFTANFTITEEGPYYLQITADDVCSLQFSGANLSLGYSVIGTVRRYLTPGSYSATYTYKNSGGPGGVALMIMKSASVGGNGQSGIIELTTASF